MRCQLPDFETVFRIPADHTLRLDGTCSRGGRIYGMAWSHSEYDPAGRLVARYESYDEIGADRDEPRCGWRRYDPAGHLTHAHEIDRRWSALVEQAAPGRAAETFLQNPDHQAPGTARRQAAFA
ncbi:hypothetical protein EOE48_16670 [Methylobacterium oryzihabitans]|uniref:Uncharacterized protein n=1 Tax=Methylobacterium oryzihabitans TaxID=2499852 RepID=A0A3S3U5X4_9HYPH|nr:hypothetical protein EOE48_16670 [Methylobacterium oryzihabitans]